MQDRLLVNRALSGDRAAERSIYDQHVRPIFGLVYRMAGDEHLAEDFTQETFVRAFQRLDQYRGEAALGTWLRAIAVSVALNGLRKVKRLREREYELDEGMTGSSRAARSEPDLKEKLTRAVDGLPERYRTVFVMHDIEGYKHREIAEMLGIPAGTSKAQLSRARRRLRDELSEFAEEWAS